MTATVFTVMLVNMWCENEYHFDVYLATNSAHTEIYHVSQKEKLLSFVTPNCATSSV
jgi:hypothetical protein